jgi:dihydromonapterin reductase/dihydrofolate reductase
LQNRVLITGAGRRVGLYLAQQLQLAGYSVVAHYRTETDGVQALRQLGVETIQGSFESKEAILAFASAVKSRFNSFRAIIHNASSFYVADENLNQAADQYEQFFLVHMMAPYLINETLRPLLESEDDNPCDIIHITDINAENPTALFDIYCSTKAGLHNLTLSLAKKYAPDVKVNAVAPGPVLFAEMHTGEVKAQTLSETLLQREGGLEPVYLAVKSILDNPFLTGISLPVDGGRRLSKR